MLDMYKLCEGKLCTRGVWWKTTKI